MIKQQIIGTLTLSLYVIGLFYLFPSLLLHPLGPILVALILAAVVWRIQFSGHKAFQKALLYVPTGTHKEQFDALIRSCNIEPSMISLKYAYTAEQIAMAASNTIVIDPVLCSLCDEDSNGQIVKNVFAQHIEPHLTSTQKIRLSEFRKILTPQAQCFIFKHEIGHAVDNYSTKKLTVTFLTIMIAVYVGIITAKSLMFHYHAFVATVIGIVVFTLLDYMFPFLSNVLFKLPAEKRADRFAARYSSADEIKAAAYFFKKHQEIINENPEPGNYLARLPSALISGHPDGKTRCVYLLRLADQKK
ncbi:MAG TPA: M48 family metalloprotease [Candidatus Saccharimonadales bacterium]|nr:M48 family metalloprotease [Candidatus Saccharimonadales bacterium]